MAYIQVCTHARFAGQLKGFFGNSEGTFEFIVVPIWASWALSSDPADQYAVRLQKSKFVGPLGITMILRVYAQPGILDYILVALNIEPLTANTIGKTKEFALHLGSS